VAATVIEDLVSRKWLAEIVSAEETSTQVQVVFTEALEAEGLLGLVTARQDGLVDPTVDDPSRPVLLALSDIHSAWRADLSLWGPAGRVGSSVTGARPSLLRSDWSGFGRLLAR
jgi:hypothetical protein